MSNTDTYKSKEDVLTDVSMSTKGVVKLHPTGYAEMSISDIKKAMDIWANHEAIRFAEWVMGSLWDFNSDTKKWFDYLTEQNNFPELTSEQLYDLYIQSIK